MPAQGTPLQATQFRVVNRIPNVKQTHWPKELPVFRQTQKRRDFPLSSLQALISESAFRETNISGTPERIRLVSADGLNHFTVNAAEGRISLHNADEVGVVDVPSDAVPTFEAVRDRAVRVAASFGISTNEMERDTNGSVHVVRSDRETSRQGGRIKFKRSRTVELARGLAGQTFGSLNDQKVTLELGIDGRLLKFDLKWPVIEAVVTNRVFSIADVLDEIRTGKALSDALNEYPPDGITEIEVKDIVIDYYVSAPLNFGASSAKADIYPVASLLVAFKSKKGDTQEGGMYAPIMDSR